MAAQPNPFIGIHVPMLWSALIKEFGRNVQYVPKANPQAATITVIWKDGASAENVNPGRFSHIYVKNADLLAPPVKGDKVQTGDGKLFSVMRVDVTPYDFSLCVLQEIGAVP